MKARTIILALALILLAVLVEPIAAPTHAAAAAVTVDTAPLASQPQASTDVSPTAPVVELAVSLVLLLFGTIAFLPLFAEPHQL